MRLDLKTNPPYKYPSTTPAKRLPSHLRHVSHLRHHWQKPVACPAASNHRDSDCARHMLRCHPTDVCWVSACQVTTKRSLRSNTATTSRRSPAARSRAPTARPRTALEPSCARRTSFVPSHSLHTLALRSVELCAVCCSSRDCQHMCHPIQHHQHCHDAKTRLF